MPTRKLMLAVRPDVKWAFDAYDEQRAKARASGICECPVCCGIAKTDESVPEDERCCGDALEVEWDRIVYDIALQVMKRGRRLVNGFLVYEEGENCEYCDAVQHQGPDDDCAGYLLECPECGRVGCDECMPSGRGVVCPECEGG